MRANRARSNTRKVRIMNYALIVTVVALSGAAEESYNADKSTGYAAKDGAIMSCYLVRDTGKTSRANASR